MCMHLLAFETLRKIISEQENMPDLYSVTSLGPRNVEICRDNFDGMEALIQSIGTAFGMTASGLNLIDKQLGWLCVVQADRVSARQATR